ncbi:cadherin-23-like [Wyeomyia smithii]|uniref:cadherin-23-like n=1 Tax=Wyeomyia smithii TaxID=174621 RepID=UPI002467B017|nr:cadherin-23-like [Wyeomyia smithii]XP_055551432.1 cadherin-23-like [Wyeomyia smithii]XP_055551433.1 cadherin-23-like [Wyeomyia smithii]XP_055551434.1 cadherin-23-like [Wyeomyia smithii]XP_055551435.1 cadherin-23-like [Wyeomyia smithii]XP_055551436.1 cadherin-23-like [Wyeomyia smithii]
MDEHRRTMRFLLLIALVLGSSALDPPGEWESPPFESVDDRIKVSDYDDETTAVLITLPEEIPSPFTMVKLNYRGDRISLVDLPDGLGAQLVREGNELFIVINSRLDYEQPAHQKYMINMIVENVRIFIRIKLLNILDNAPVMSSDNDCLIDEGRGDFLSNCSYTVRHDDGFEKDGIESQFTNRLEFVIPDSEAELFEFEETGTVDVTKQFQLRVRKPLDYSLRAVYSFPVTVYDLDRRHNFTLNLVVQVQNVESRFPIFTRPFTTQRIPEKERLSTLVIALDGDTGLNMPICYSVEAEEQEKYGKYFSIDSQTGLLSVAGIDRDAEQNEIYKFTISAYKCHNPAYVTKNEAAIILDDINDNSPKVNVTPTELVFWENTQMELPVNRFFIEDIDLGDHATYQVELHEKVSGIDLPGADSFSIVPTGGYQLTHFTLTIVNTNQLDYELPERQWFQLIVTATELANSSHTDQQELNITLLNWNDEVPVFDQDTYDVEINETIETGYPLLQVHVTDRDVDDVVNLRILSRISNDLAITRLSDETSANTFSFEISTNRDGIFDYDVAPEVIVQLEAQDTLQTAKEEPVHKVFAQIVINVLDVNNKPPTITVPRGVMQIAENSEPNTAITIDELSDAEIIGTDPDTTADLQFTIDWQTSYGVKEGRQVAPEKFEGCLVFDVNREDRNRVVGKIRVNPELDQETINKKLDYETYETLFLTVKLVDSNQVVPPGDTEAIIVVQIKDVNDNAPEFKGNTLQIDRFVLEEAETGTIVGSIAAEDKDGPEFNQISYNLSPQVTDHEGWIMIDATGMLSVNATEKPIDCDIPVTYYIPLNITLSDGLFETHGTLQITITDTNNKIPSFESMPEKVEIWEKSSSGTEILEMEVTDLDRDEPFHTVAFEIDYKTSSENLQYYFEVNSIVESVPANQRSRQLGRVVVKENNRLLDRDNGIERFTISVKAHDNPNSSGRKNTAEALFTLVLLDINDQTPEMPEYPELLLKEDALKGAPVVVPFTATDRDDRNTPNAKINYQLTSISAAGENSAAVVADQETIDTLFTVQQTGEYVASFEVGKNLKGFYGSWTVGIEACDRGDEYELVTNSPRLCANATYTVRVDPVNYMAPEINYPTNEERIRLKFESLANGRPLVNVQGETISNFAATDTDGGDFGVVNFSLQSTNADSQDHVYFALNTLDKNHAQLVLVNAEAVEDKAYQVTVIATDGGNLSSKPVKIVIVFIDMTGEPAFEDTVFETDFTENELGLAETRTIPAADDPKNAELPPEEHKNVFYFIDDAYGSSSHLFELNKETRVLRLTQELDREEIASHEIRVIATNNINGPTTSTPADSKAALIVRIKVNDVNDNPPKFRSDTYSAGITSNDYSGKILFTVVADDPDEDDLVTYSIDASSLEAQGDNLPTSPMPFNMGAENGQLSLATQIQSTMKGYYTFTIVATDLVDHTDRASVKIYLITESNRVKFVFLNYKAEVDTPEMRSFLEEQLGAHYEMACNIDDVVQGSLGGVTRADEDQRVTDVRAHFIRNNEAVEAVEIQQRSNDRVFVTNLKTALSARQLLLQDVPITSVEEIEETNELLNIVLIVVASALGIVCVILLVAFCIKIRSLNRQLKALSATDFGSIASDINGGRKVPTSNVFAVEGSNPVLNDHAFPKGAFDDISVQSYESDFVGIDNDLFKTDRKDDELNPQLIEHIKQHSLNPMVNGGGGTGQGITLRRETDSTDELTHKF